MFSKIKALSKGNFVRNVAIVATGTAGAQAITIAFAPIITRLYGPEAFGLLGSFTAVLAVLTPLAALTYPIAIVLPKSDIDATKIAKLSALIAIVIALFAAIVLLFTEHWITESLNLEPISGLLLLIPLAMLFSAYQQILTQWLIRKKQYRITARVAVIQAFTINSTKAGVGFIHPAGTVLIVIATIGQALHALMLLAGIRGKSTALPNDDESTGSIREMAVRHCDFPIYRMPQLVLSSLSMNLPILMLASLFGSSAAGLYSLSKAILGAPSVLISKSVSDVFYPKAAETYNNGFAIDKLILKTTLGLAAIGLIPLVVVGLFGPFLFGLIFGSDWVAAGNYARWLAIFMFFNFINTPAVAAIPVLGKQRWFLMYGLFSAGLRVAGIFIGYSITNDPVIAVAFFSVFGSIAYCYLIIFTIIKSRTCNSQ